MKYDPDRHNRRSIRLRGYDYSRSGAYFVTVCTQNRKCLLGEIRDGEMVLNDAGQMVERWWLELNGKYPFIQMDEFVVMPNHFHGIINIIGASDPANIVVYGGAHTGAPLRRPIPDYDDTSVPVNIVVGADLRVRPVPDHRGAIDHDDTSDHRGAIDHGDASDHRGAIDHGGAHTGAPLRRPIPGHGDASVPVNIVVHGGAHTGAPLHAVLQWFKTMTTNEYIRGVKQHGWPPFPGKLWQRNYYEHIIRNDMEMDRIRKYIINNPLKWDLDRENPNSS